MSGETEQNISGWTVDTLHVHLLGMLREKDLRDNQRFEAQQLALRDALVAQEKAVTAALVAAERAVTKAEVAAEKRADNANEFRAQLSDQAATFMPRTEATVALQAQGDRLTTLERRMNQAGGHSSGLSDGWKYLVGFAALCGPIIALIVLVTR